MIAPFGTTKAGHPVDVITLHAGDLTAKILTFGAILNDVRLKGVPYGLTLGSNDLAAYDGGPMGYFGALVGPVANRIAGASATLDGQVFTFDANEGATTLHGGAEGIQTEIWQIADHTDRSVTLTLALPDGKGGFPGTRLITAQFEIDAPATLRLRLSATTDAPTFMNIANHSYWSLDGRATTEGHWLKLNADRYTPVDARMIPTGVCDVAGTGFDLSEGRVLRPSDTQRYDHNFCLSDRASELKQAAVLKGETGVTLVMETTEPGLQVFDAAPIGSGNFPGHRGVPEVGFCGLALEAQRWPDAPNQPGFPSVVLRPGETYAQETLWRFSKD